MSKAPTNATDRPEPWMIPQEDWDSYYHALGKFMHMFARAEVGLNITLAQVAISRIKPEHGVPGMEIVRALVSGLRPQPAQQTLKRIFRLTNPRRATSEERDAIRKRDEAIEHVLSHFSELHFLRDRLAHYGATARRFEGVTVFDVDNSVGARERHQREILYVSTQLLLDGAADLETVSNRLAAAYSPGFEPMNPRAPWHYTPSRLKRSRPK